MIETKKDKLLQAYKHILKYRKTLYHEEITKIEHYLIMMSVAINSVISGLFIWTGNIASTLLSFILMYLTWFVFNYIISKRLCSSNESHIILFKPWFKSYSQKSKEKLVFKNYIREKNYRDLQNFELLDKEIMDEISLFNGGFSKKFLLIILTICLSIFINYISNFENSYFWLSFATALIILYFGLVYHNSKRSFVSKLILIRNYL